MQLQTRSPESKFPDKYSDVIFIQIDQHLKKSYCKNTKGSRFMNHGVVSGDILCCYLLGFSGEKASNGSTVLHSQ